MMHERAARILLPKVRKDSKEQDVQTEERRSSRGSLGLMDAWSGGGLLVLTRSSSDRQGPDIRSSAVALLLIDVINPMDFDGAEALIPAAIAAAKQIARLKRRAREADVPIVYVNDNFNCWHLGFRELVETFRSRGVPGAPLIELLAPEPEFDFYVLKPSHSGFFRTGLEVLLKRLEARTLVLTGFAGDICVLFTANDAYMRGFDVVVPEDCVASERAADNDHALRHMARLLKASIVRSDALDLDAMRGAVASGRTA
jgi:nicotinamidase-related amidase